MKLLKNQYLDITGALDKYGIKEGNFILVKKRGRIRIQVDNNDSYFEFFRRKSFSLTDDTHQWKKSEHYELNTAGKPILAVDWNEVVTHLESWLKCQNFACH